MAIRLGTRASALAVAQSTAVARSLEALGEEVELIEIATSGDETAPVPETEDKARFVKELEGALLDGRIDLAVHSAKDVPGELPDGLEIVAVPERADARDALCLAPQVVAPEPAVHSVAAHALDALPEGATVGTASLRRRSQLLALRPDLRIAELRGNVDTRLRKLADGDGLDAIVLAAAGLARLGRSAEGAPLSELALVPAPGQGSLALEARADDDATRKLACRLTDPHAFACLTAERTVVGVLGATCHTPVGAHATIVNHSLLHVEAYVGSPDGQQWIRDDIRGMAEDPRSVGTEVADRLIAAGAREILAAG